MKKLFLVLIIVLAGCSSQSNKIKKDVFITNITSGANIVYSNGGAGNNALPFIIITNQDLNDIEVYLTNEQTSYQLTSSVQEIIMDNIPVSSNYIYSKFDFDLSEIEEKTIIYSNYSEADKITGKEEVVKIQNELEDLLKISDQQLDEAKAIMDNLNVYFVDAGFTFDTVTYPSEFSSIVIQSEGKNLYEQAVTIRFDEDVNSEKLYQMSGALLGYETEFGESINLSYRNAFTFFDDTILRSILIDNEDYNVHSLTVKHKSGDGIFEYFYENEALGELNIDVLQGDIVAYEMEVSVTPKLKPLFYGSFKTSVILDDEAFSFDSGVISTTLDPYVYYGFIEEGITEYRYINLMQSFNKSLNSNDLSEYFERE